MDEARLTPLLANYAITRDRDVMAELVEGYLPLCRAIARKFRGQGVATALADGLEQSARAEGHRKLVTHASITARPFFEKRGYQVVREQQVERKGLLLTNYVMEKML